MGETVEFRCQCGFTKKMEEGCGYLEYELDPGKKPEYLESALCVDCSKMIQIDKYDEHHRCDSCNGNNITLYSDPCLRRTTKKTIQCKKRILKSETSADDIEDIFDDTNYDFVDCDEVVDDKTYYFCPKCNKFLIERHTVELWD